MKMNRTPRYKRTTMFCTVMIALASFTYFYSIVWQRFYASAIQLPFYRRGNWLMVAVYALLLYVFTSLYGGYKVGASRVSELVYSQALSVLFVNFFTYLQISLVGRQWMTPVPMLILSLAEILSAVVWAWGANRIYLSLYPPYQMLMIYGSDLADLVSEKMSLRPDRYQITETIHIDEGLERVLERASEFETVALCDVRSEMRNKIVKYCFDHSIRIYIVPKISDILLRGAQEIQLFDTPLFLCSNEGLGMEQRIAKRALDLAFCIPALILTLPFMAVTAAAIWLYDRGPVLFRQKRLTIDEREFTVYKFRSMVVDAERDGVARLASSGDDRITPVGRIIRKIRLDELPQLFNILLGDMSVVGPRPERPEIARQYQEDMPEFNLRLKVKAGLTGYAQVLGKYNTTPYDKLKLDLIYIQNYSILLDLKIMMMTVRILFLPESTEGIDANNVTAARAARRKKVKTAAKGSSELPAETASAVRE